MHTLASEAATRRACASKSSMPEERVINSARQCSFCLPGGLESRIAWATVSSRTFGSNGFVKKENTPRRVAATASGIVPCAVSITTGSDGEFWWIASNSARPSMPCILRSVTTTCGRATARLASACSPDSTAVTAYPAALSRIAISCNRSLSSSISRTLSCSLAIGLPLFSAQFFLALEDASFNCAQRVELLSQRFLAFVALLVGGEMILLRHGALSRQPLDLASEALTLG